MITSTLQQDMSGHEILSNHDIIVITLWNVKLVPIFIKKWKWHPSVVVVEDDV